MSWIVADFIRLLTNGCLAVMKNAESSLHPISHHSSTVCRVSYASGEPIVCILKRHCEDPDAIGRRSNPSIPCSYKIKTDIGVIYRQGISLLRVLFNTANQVVLKLLLSCLHRSFTSLRADIKAVGSPPPGSTHCPHI